MSDPLTIAMTSTDHKLHGSGLDSSGKRGGGEWDTAVRNAQPGWQMHYFMF